MDSRLLHMAEPGTRFGRGVVICEERLPLTPGMERHGFRKGPRGARMLCDCGNEYVSALTLIHRGLTKSCGCLHDDAARERCSDPATAPSNHKRTHGRKKHPSYARWKAMLARCEDPRAKGYERWGGRGIKVCEEWHDVTAFVDYLDRELGPCPPRHTLDRINNDGHYEPGNVRWATYSEQQRNRRRKGQ